MTPFGSFLRYSPAVVLLLLGTESIAQGHSLFGGVVCVSSSCYVQLLEAASEARVAAELAMIAAGGAAVASKARSPVVFDGPPTVVFERGEHVVVDGIGKRFIDCPDVTHHDGRNAKTSVDKAGDSDGPYIAHGPEYISIC